MMSRTKKPSNIYWKEREIEHAKSMLTDEKKIIAKIKGLYQHTARETEKEILSMLSGFASKEGVTLAEAKKMVNVTDIRDYESKAKRYVKEKNFTDRANKEMALYNLKMKMSRLELIMEHINLELIAMTDGTEKIVFDRLLDVGTSELKRQAGILGTTINVNVDDVRYIARRKFHNDDFSNRLWKTKAKLHRELEKNLTESITKGVSPRVTARKLRKEIEQSVFNSERIMITETARVQTESQKMSFDKMDIKQYEFIVTEGACDVCLPLDGSVIEVSEMSVGENAPPMHPFCKCSTAGHVERDM